MTVLAIAPAPEPPVNQWDTLSLLNRGSILKASIDAQKEELAAINLELLERAAFPNGGSTSHIQAGGIKAKIVRKENVKYDQERLLEVMNRLPVMFSQAFKPKYEPVSAALKTYMAADKDFAQAILLARIVTPAAPSVTYEKLEG